MEWVKGLWDKVKASLDVQKIVCAVVDSAVGAVVDLAIKQVGEWVVSLNPVGGIVKVLKAVWDVLRWVYDNRQRLLTLGTAVVEGFKTLLSDGGEDAVADLVEHGLAQAFVPALDLIAKQFGLDVIPQKIREVVGKLVGIVPNEVKDLLLKLKAWIWDKIKALVGGLFGKTRWVAHGREHELWIDYKEGQVLTSGSPTVIARDELTRLEELAKKAKDTTALGLIAKARTLVGSMEKLIVQAKEEAAAAPAAKGKEGEPAPKAAKKKTGAQAALDKDTGPLATMLKEIQERVEGGAGGSCALRAGAPGAGAGAAAAAKCLVGATRPLLQRGLGAPIAQVRPGWALAWRPGVRARARPNRSGLRLVRLELDYGGGAGVEADLLRPAGWESAVEGGVVWLEMPEMGAVGWARVRAVEPCPELEDGPGALITGWFRHRRGTVYELRVEGGEEALGITGRTRCGRWTGRRG